MLFFLASVLEQLDLALEHVSQGDVNNARFGLMLTDNAVELILHQIAKDKASELKTYSSLKNSYEHQAALDKALKRSFDDKVRFARLEGKLTQEVARTISIMHEFRNEIYHIGIQHEEILPELALFYFSVGCAFIGDYQSRGLGWGSGQKLPERAKKYFTGSKFFPGERDDFRKGCASLNASSAHEISGTIEVLATQMDLMIEQQDVCIDVVAQGVYVGQQRTRDRAVLETQAWSLAFTDEGRKFADEQGWSGSVMQVIERLSEKYPFKFKGDPVTSWRKQVEKLRARKNPHAALEHYHSFMSETASLREAIIESAGAAEAEIEAASDRARGK